MKFTADEGVDAPIVLKLRASGHTVWYVAEMAAGISDEEVLALAYREDTLLITNDKDFGALVFQQRQLNSGVMLLRLVGLSAAGKAVLVERVVSSYGDQLIGAFTVITPRRIRIRDKR